MGPRRVRLHGRSSAFLVPVCAMRRSVEAPCFGDECSQRSVAFVDSEFLIRPRFWRSRDSPP
eukprot:7814085-Lingulodinium_polyedra.AAC.1